MAKSFQFASLSQKDLRFIGLLVFWIVAMSVQFVSLSQEVL
jgi:hypothetical protein